MANTTKAPTWYWVVTIILTVWNILGVMAYLGQAYMTEEALSAMPEEQQILYDNIPAWATAAFAIAVFGGFLACVSLILKKKTAYTLFIISFLGSLVQSAHSFFFSDYIEIVGAQAIVMPLIVILLCVFQIWFAKNATKNNWIS